LPQLEEQQQEEEDV